MGGGLQASISQREFSLIKINGGKIAPVKSSMISQEKANAVNYNNVYYYLYGYAGHNPFQFITEYASYLYIKLNILTIIN